MAWFRLKTGKPKSDAFREALLRSPANKDERARKEADQIYRFKNVRLKKPKT